METKRVYSIEVEGADSVNELKTAVEQLNERLKTLNETSNEYKETLAQLTEYQSKLADAMKGVSDSAESTNKSIDSIKNTVNEMTDAVSTATKGLDGLGDIDADVLNSFLSGFTDGMIEAASAATETKTKLEDLGRANSVKELKQQISELKDRLVQLDKGTDEYHDTMTVLIERQVKLKEVMNAGKNEIEAAEGSYNALTQKMSALKQVWKETTDEATRNEIGAQINDINNQLKELDASLGNHQRNVGNYKSALDGMDEPFKNLKQQLKETKDLMQQLDPATEEYNEALTKAADLSHQLAEQQEQIKYASTDLGDQLDNVRGIAANLAAGYSAVNAAMGLFGEENEDIKEAMLKVQQAMALVQGLQGLDGFIKRTKGLSVAMGLTTKATKKQTAATLADAAASKADATAKGAQATATQGAVGPQLALNAAMEANPIGFIIGLIAALVTAFILLKDKIKEMIGANDELSAAFEKVKAVLSGVGNVIKNNVINPLQACLVQSKTIANVLVDIFTGNFKKIKDDIKGGFNEVKDYFLKTINILGNFKEGYDKKIAEQNEAARKAEAAARQKDLEDQIKDNEAKYGSDWKYTEDAKKLYEELFRVRMAQYKEDADEYKEAQRDKWEYDRELAEKQTKDEEKETEKRRKAAEEANKKKEKELETQLSNFKQAFEKYMPEWNATEKEIVRLFNIWTSETKDGITAIEQFKNEVVKTMGKTSEEAQKIVEGMWTNFTKSMYNDMFGKNWNSELDKMFYNLDNKTKKYLEDRNALFEKEKTKFGLEFPTDELSEFYATYNITKKNIEKEQDALSKTMDKMYNNALTDVTVLQSLVFDEEDELGKHLKESVDYYVSVYGLYIQELENGNTEAANYYKQAFEDNMTSLIHWNNTNKEAFENVLGEYLSEYQKMLDKRHELSSEYERNELEYFTNSAEIYKKKYEIEEQQEKTYYEHRLSQMEKSYSQEELIAEKRSMLYDNGYEIQALERQKEYENEYFNEVIEMYNRLRDRYNEMSKNMKLTAEERKNAEIEAAKLTGQIIEEEMNHETELLKIQINNINAWRNAVKSAVSGISDALGNLGSYYEGLIELEKTRIDQELKDHKIDEEEAARQYQLQEDSFEKSKNFQAAQAMINGLTAAAGAYSAMASIPIVGPALGIAAAAAALATAVVNVKKIKATTMENPYSQADSDSSYSSSSTNFQLPDVMELEPQMKQNLTNQSDTDTLKNTGGDKAIKAYVVESDVSASQELSRKRSQEITF